MKKEKDKANLDNGNPYTKEKLDRIKAVAKLVREIIGTRSIRKASEDTGVAASYISGIINEKYLPSANILKKLTSPDGWPQNGITEEELMIAAGYQRDFFSDSVKMTLGRSEAEAETDNGLISGEDIFETDNNVESEEEQNREITLKEAKENYRSYRERTDRDEYAIRGILYSALAERHIRFEKDDDWNIRGLRQKLQIKVSGQCISEWCFNILLVPFDTRFVRSHIRNMFIRLMGFLSTTEPKKERKTSIILTDLDSYQLLIRYQDKLSYKGDLSIILVDLNYYAIMKEDYLSHYKDESSELYLKQK